MSDTTIETPLDLVKRLRLIVTKAKLKAKPARGRLY